MPFTKPTDSIEKANTSISDSNHDGTSVASTSTPASGSVTAAQTQAHSLTSYQDQASARFQANSSFHSSGSAAYPSSGMQQGQPQDRAIPSSFNGIMLHRLGSPALAREICFPSPSQPALMSIMDDGTDFSQDDEMEMWQPVDGSRKSVLDILDEALDIVNGTMDGFD